MSVSKQDQLKTRAVESLHNQKFIEEINRLFWTDPITNKGMFDPGWNCRDHAVILGTYLGVYGIHSQLVDGRCFFVKGPAGGAPPKGIGQEVRHPAGHTWLDVPSRGLCDISPRLSKPIPQWGSVPFFGIVFDKWLPENGGLIRMAKSARDYDKLVAMATHEEGCLQGIYFEQSRTKVELALLADPPVTINSPGAHKIVSDYGVASYWAGLAHLLEFEAGRSRPIAGVSQRKAWMILVDRYSKERSLEIISRAQDDNEAHGVV